MSNRQWVWITVHTESGLTTNIQTDSSKHAGNDDVVANIKIRGEQMMRIVIIYNQRARDTGESPARRLYWPKLIRQGGSSTVLVGKFNIHRRHRDLRCTDRRDAASFEEIIDEHGLAIGHDN
jgi:hypothetical protein